jgi:hypothetical protein
LLASKSVNGTLFLGEYAMFNPPRLLSAHAMKMSFQYDVTTVEYVLDDVAKSLDLNPNRFCLLGALLGNHILPARDLRPFHLSLAPELKDSKLKTVFDKVIRCVVNYIRALSKIDDYERICNDVFGFPDDPRLTQLKASLLYYHSASEDGYATHKPAVAKAAAGKKKKHQLMQSHIKLASELEADPQAQGQQKQQQQQEDKVVANGFSTKKTKKDKASAKTSSASAAANDLVERIALDLDKLDLTEALSVAQKMQEDEVDTEEGSPSPQPPQDSTSLTGYPALESETLLQDDRQAAAAASHSKGGFKDVEGGIVAADTSEGTDKDSDDGEKKDDASMSVVEALASGVDVAPSEDGKVRLINFVLLSRLQLFEFLAVSSEKVRNPSPAQVHPDSRQPPGDLQNGVGTAPPGANVSLHLPVDHAGRD